MPEGVFYFEEKIIQKTNKRMFEKKRTQTYLYAILLLSSAQDRDSNVDEFCALERNRRNA